LQVDDDLDLLTGAARAAGEIGLRFAETGAQSWDKPGGAGPVTEADLAVDMLLAERLRTARPGYGWLSEESTDGPARLDSDRVFIVDPIDGTREFISGGRAWAHALAVVEQGRVIAAAIHLPRLDKLYAAAAGRGATLNGRPIRVTARTKLTGAHVLAAKPSYDAHNWRGAVPELSRAYRPSLAYRLSLVAEGRYDAMMTLRDSWEWDVAAGELILREAGAQVSDRRAGPLRFNNTVPKVNGVVAAGPVLHAALTGALAE